MVKALINRVPKKIIHGTKTEYLTAQTTSEQSISSHVVTYTQKQHGAHSGAAGVPGSKQVLLPHKQDSSGNTRLHNLVALQSKAKQIKATWPLLINDDIYDISKLKVPLESRTSPKLHRAFSWPIINPFLNISCKSVLKYLSDFANSHTTEKVTTAQMNQSRSNRYFNRK